MDQKIIRLFRYMRSGKIQTGSNIIVFLIFILLQLFFQSCEMKNSSKVIMELQVNYNVDSTIVTSIGYSDIMGKQGEWYFFDDKGHLELIENYVNNVSHGKGEMYICCKKFQEYNVVNGKFIGRVTNFAPSGDIVSISYYDSSQESFSFGLHNSKIYEINKFDENRNMNLMYSDTSILNISDQFPASYGCCKLDDD